jgi:DUF2407 ubiquitin-like domain
MMQHHTIIHHDHLLQRLPVVAPLNKMTTTQRRPQQHLTLYPKLQRPSQLRSISLQTYIFTASGICIVTVMCLTLMLIAPSHVTSTTVYVAATASTTATTGSLIRPLTSPLRSDSQQQQQQQRYRIRSSLLQRSNLNRFSIENFGGVCDDDTIIRIPTECWVLHKIHRGGATVTSNENEPNAETIQPLSSSSSSSSSSSQLAPVTIFVQTNAGSSMIDPMIELPLVNPNKRTILSIKQSIQRQLASSSSGKPPISTIQLIYQGQVLTDDELLLAEVLDEEEEEDDDDDDDKSNEENNAKTSDGKQIKMYIDMIPPVDAKNFMYDIESKLEDTTTSDLLLAYATNEASLYFNAQQIEVLRNTNANKEVAAEEEGDADTNTLNTYDTKQSPRGSSLISVQIRERAQQIQTDLVETILQTSQSRKLLSDPETPKQKVLRASLSRSGGGDASMSDLEIRGDRVRHIGISGIRGSYIRLLQHELNIEDWYRAMKHCLLFLFFGYFGGRTTVSRTILLLGAPLMILIQTRFMKLYIRQVLYTVLYNPPSIVLSLLPAPQQAILSLNMSDAMKRIFGEYIVLDELTKQLLLDDPSIEDVHIKSNDLSKVLTSKRFTVKASKDVGEEEEDDDDDDDDEYDADEDDDENNEEDEDEDDE